MATSSEEENLTPALTYLKELQERHPPLYPISNGLDRAQQLYNNLEEVLPSDVRDLFSSGTVALGEIGIKKPDIGCTPIEGNGYVIEFNSGMMDFIYAIARCLSGLSVRLVKSGPENEPAMGKPDVARCIADLYGKWSVTGKLISRLFRIKHSEVKITDNVKYYAEVYATLAELFMLAHEIGHIAINDKIMPIHPKGHPELYADTFAFGCMIKYGQKPGEHLNLLYGGAVFAVRIFTGLEQVGITFPDDYPSPQERIKNLHQALLSVCSRQKCIELSNIVVSLQDMMDDVDVLIGKHKQPILSKDEQTDRILARLIAELAELVRGTNVMPSVIADINQTVEQTPPDIMQKIIRDLYRFYLLKSREVSWFDEESKDEMRARILNIIPQLGEKAKGIFEDNLPKLKS